MMDPWNAPAHCYFIAHTARDDFRHVLGLPVIDEFATFSSPIFFAPIPILGKIYNAGISLGHLRDPEMGLETGWPPLCIGFDEPAPVLPADWEQTLLKRLQSVQFSNPEVEKSVLDVGSISIDDYVLQRMRVGGFDHSRLGTTTVFATDAPLLPRQLKRITQFAKTPFAIAFSTGNRVVSKEDPIPATVQVVSEDLLGRILTGFSKLEQEIL
jgi:hypothetical protein